MQAELERSGVELVCLAGFMRVLTPWFIGRWPDRLVNIHPSLLPSYRGLHTHERALADGVRIHGCTVHLVVPELDAGPIIAQAAVPVHAADTPDTLAARVLAAEHRIYPRALSWLASGRVRNEAGRPVDFISDDRVVDVGEVVNVSQEAGSPRVFRRDGRDAAEPGVPARPGLSFRRNCAPIAPRFRPRRRPDSDQSAIRDLTMTDRRLSVGALLLTCLLALAGTAVALTAADIDPAGALHLSSTPIATPASLAREARSITIMQW